MKTISDYCKECHDITKSKGFWDKDRNFGELLMLIVSELGECLESHRKNNWAIYDNFVKEWKANGFETAFKLHLKDSVEDELSDVFIRLFDLIEAYEIDIEEHIKLKMKYNKTREKLHGKKYWWNLLLLQIISSLSIIILIMKEITIFYLLNLIMQFQIFVWLF